MKDIQRGSINQTGKSETKEFISTIFTGLLMILVKKLIVLFNISDLIRNSSIS
jgi:hypothetical protein